MQNAMAQMDAIPLLFLLFHAVQNYWMLIRWDRGHFFLWGRFW